MPWCCPFTFYLCCRVITLPWCCSALMLCSLFLPLFWHAPELSVPWHNGTLLNGHITKRYVLQNGTRYKTVRVTKWYALQNGTRYRTVTLQNGTCYDIRFVTYRFVTYRFVTYRFITYHCVTYRFVMYRSVTYRYVTAPNYHCFVVLQLRYHFALMLLLLSYFS